VDPPAYTAIVYATVDSSKFLSIDDFPSGFQGQFTVSSGAKLIGRYLPGQQVVFPTGGVTEFVVSDISPAPENNHPESFPLNIALDSAQSLFIAGPLASFELPSASTCAGNVSASIRVARTGFRRNNATGRYLQSVTLTNLGQPLPGAFALAIDSLSANATLYHPAGTTSCSVPSGSPFLVFNPGINWTTGQSVTVNLEFINPANLGISYTPRVLTGGPDR
jgi:hypothetical protein